MNKEQASEAYIKGKLRDHQEYLGCEESRRMTLIQSDMYTVQQSFEDGWDEAKKNLSNKVCDCLYMTREEEINNEAKLKCHDIASEVDYKFSAAYDGFVMGAEWADKTMIEKACEWLSDNMRRYAAYDFELVEDLRKAMEE